MSEDATPMIDGAQVIEALEWLDSTEGSPEEVIEARTRIDWESFLPHIGKVAAEHLPPPDQGPVPWDDALKGSITGFAMGLWVAGYIFNRPASVGTEGEHGD